jgi:hypothetical protein
MTYISILAALLSILSAPARAQTPQIPVSHQETAKENAMTQLTEAQARAAITPWYSLFNIAT